MVPPVRRGEAVTLLGGCGVCLAMDVQAFGAPEVQAAARRVGQIDYDLAPSQIRAMSVRRHSFKVGQTVVAPYSGLHGLIPRGPYVIVRLLPQVDGEPQYRVRSAADGHERALLESQVKLMEEQPGNVVIPLPRRAPKATKPRG